MGTEDKKRNLALIEPKFKIGRTIYVPQRDKVVKTKIIGYDARTSKDKNKKLPAVIFGYHIRHFVQVRRGDDSEMTGVVLEEDFYVREELARDASRFLEVKASEEEWKLAIGDRDVEDEDSPYFLENCGLPPCCADVSEMRDILFYCKRNSGLIAHDRDELSRLVMSHDSEWDVLNPLGRIYERLEII